MTCPWGPSYVVRRELGVRVSTTLEQCVSTIDDHAESHEHEADSDHDGCARDRVPLFVHRDASQASLSAEGRFGGVVGVGAERPTATPEEPDYDEKGAQAVEPDRDGSIEADAREQADRNSDDENGGACRSEQDDQASDGAAKTATERQSRVYCGPPPPSSASVRAGSGRPPRGRGRTNAEVAPRRHRRLRGSAGSGDGSGTRSAG